MIRVMRKSFRFLNSQDVGLRAEERGTQPTSSEPRIKYYALQLAHKYLLRHHLLQMRHDQVHKHRL
jgi:hypothetical protein